jgi:hypothetical protein
MAYTHKQRQRINLRAKRKVGLIKRDSDQDKEDFIDQCVSDLVDNGEATDEDAAEEMCERMWEEGDDSMD